MLKGFSLIEIIIAIGLFIILATGAAGIVNLNQNALRLAFEYDQAYSYLDDGVNIVRNLKKSNWNNLSNGNYGLQENSGVYEFTENNDTWNKFTRQITIANAYRDNDENLTTDDSGDLDENAKAVTISVNWDYSQAQSKTIQQTIFLTNWQKPVDLVPPEP